MTQRFFSLTVLCVIFCSVVFPVSAQTPIALTELQIAFWPEYDRSSMLVIYRGVLAPEVSLPASLTFSVPAQYGPPVAVAYSDAQERLLNLQYTTAVSGDVMTVSFTAPAANFQFEYYDSSLDVSSSTRRYTFAGVAAYSIQTLVLQVQQPAGANNLTATPALAQSTVGTDGLNYFTAVRENVPAGEAIAFDLTYTKTSSALTVSNQPATDNTASDTTAPASSPAASPALVTAVIVGIVGVGLVGGGLVWFARSRRTTAAPSTTSTAGPRRLKGHPPRPKEVSPTVTASPSESPASFCHECGARLQPGDVFCRNCGTKMR
ncbi:MAG: zinc ribbon domain-containing protein [Chloroflexi bacterium]|nr:zinc ribbon domain-containing protein [Chloroflexota bacterium]